MPIQGLLEEWASWPKSLLGPGTGNIWILLSWKNSVWPLDFCAYAESKWQLKEDDPGLEILVVNVSVNKKPCKSDWGISYWLVLSFFPFSPSLCLQFLLLCPSICLLFSFPPLSSLLLSLSISFWVSDGSSLLLFTPFSVCLFLISLARLQVNPLVFSILREPQLAFEGIWSGQRWWMPWTCLASLNKHLFWRSLNL